MIIKLIFAVPACTILPALIVSALVQMRVHVVNIRRGKETFDLGQMVGVALIAVVALAGFLVWFLL